MIAMMHILRSVSRKATCYLEIHMTTQEWLCFCRSLHIYSGRHVHDIHKHLSTISWYQHIESIMVCSHIYIRMPSFVATSMEQGLRWCTSRGEAMKATIPVQHAFRGVQCTAVRSCRRSVWLCDPQGWSAWLQIYFIDDCDDEHFVAFTAAHAAAQ